MSGAPVEVTTKYVTTVDDITAAWSFVMSHVDLVGPDPEIGIRPMRIIGVSEMDAEGDREWPRQFEVSVSGIQSTGQENA